MQGKGRNAAYSIFARGCCARREPQVDAAERSEARQSAAGPSMAGHGGAQLSAARQGLQCSVEHIRKSVLGEAKRRGGALPGSASLGLARRGFARHGKGCIRSVKRIGNGAFDEVNASDRSCL